MAASTWRSSQLGPRSPSPSTRRSYSSKTTPLASSTVSSSSSSASTLLHSVLAWLSPFSSERSISPNHHGVAKFPGKDKTLPPTQNWICMCAPSTHPGSFRCSSCCSSTTHATQTPTATSISDRLTVRRFAMMNSQARSGTVEGDFGRRALTSLTRSSSHKQCRRRDFHRQRSRLSVMSKAEDH